MERSWIFNIFFCFNYFLLYALFLASWVRRALLCLESSGEYFFKSLNKTFVWFLSRALENWAIVGGTLILVRRILFCLWKVMYLGHLTNLVRFLFGCMSLPTLKLRGLLWKRGLVFLSTFLAPFFALIPFPWDNWKMYHGFVTKNNLLLLWV